MTSQTLISWIPIPYNITKSDKSVLNIKDLKTDKLLKWCSSAGKQFHGLTTLSAKKPFAHINTAVARQEFVCMAPGVMVTVSKSEKVLWVHGGKTEDDFM